MEAKLVKTYVVLQAVKDPDGYDHIVETTVESADPAVDIWLNIDQYPNILSVKEATKGG